MNALSIFAGLDATGRIRFVGDVPRGAECGCRCVACGAPLVARRGDVRTWHFAHEASQERPDCYAGAVNLLRRLAIERMKDLGLPPLPTFRTTVTAPPPFPPLQEVVEWPPGDGEIERWEARFLQNTSVALLRLASGTAVRIFVEIEGALSAPHLPHTEDEGMLLFTIPLPSSSEHLKDIDVASHHIAATLRSRWIRLPDATVRVNEARQRVKDKAEKVRDETQALRRIGGRPFLPDPADPSLSPLAALPSTSHLSESDHSPWAAWRKPRSAFLCYGLQDGSAWILFTHRDGRHVMAPWPLDEGWDESMPARIGVPNLELRVYMLEDQLRTMIYLGEMRPRVQSASTWSDLLGIAWLHASLKSNFR